VNARSHIIIVVVASILFLAVPSVEADHANQPPPQAEIDSRNVGGGSEFYGEVTETIPQEGAPTSGEPPSQEHPTVTANDLVPLLVSRRQGLRKSTFCRLLMPPELNDYYADKFELTATAAHEPRLAKLGLINLDEFDRYTPRQNATLKNLLQLKSLSMRRSYRQELMALPRVASFIATSNVNEVLTDPTGSRRFVCVEVNAPIDCSPIDHAQVFAQLRSEVLSGAPCYLDRATTEALERSNAPFRVFSPLAERFSRFFRLPTTDAPGEWHTVTELYDRFRRRCPAAVRGLSLQTFAREVRSLGFPTAHRRRGNCYRVVEV